MEWSDVVKLIKMANPADLALSKKHCHAMGVHSIVIGRRGGKLTRVFLAVPGHTLWKNGRASEKYSVGIHDHQYHLAISHVFGEIWHMRYTLEKNRFAELLNAYSFVSGGCNDTPTVTALGSQWVSPESVYRLLGTLSIGHEVLHTMAVPLNEPAAWLVREGERVKNKTMLYSDSQVIDTTGFYQPFDGVDEIVSLVESINP